MGPPSLIAENDIELGADGFFQQSGKEETGAAGAARAAFGRLAGFANVFNSFVRAVCAHIEVMFALRWRTDVTVFAPIVLHFFAANELIEVKRRGDPAEGQSIRFGDAVNVVGRDHRTRPGHVLNDKIRIARNILRHMLGNQPGPKIVDVAGRVAARRSESSCPENRVFAHVR